MSSSNVNIDTESKSSNDDDDVVRECPLNGGLKKSKGKRKKSTSLRLKFMKTYLRVESKGSGRIGDVRGFRLQ